MVWLVVVGVIMGGATLGVITWAEGAFDRTVALTMGVVTFSLASLLFSLATRDEARTVFSLDTLSDKTFVRSTALSILTLVLTTVLGPLQAHHGAHGIREILGVLALAKKHGPAVVEDAARAAAEIGVLDLSLPSRVRRPTPAAPTDAHAGRPAHS